MKTALLKVLGFGLILGCLVAISAGQAWAFWPFSMDDSPGKPNRIVAVWVDTVLNRAGEPPVRGFGGRLMFYEPGKPDPVKIEGRYRRLRVRRIGARSEQRPA